LTKFRTTSAAPIKGMTKARTSRTTPAVTAFRTIAMMPMTSTAGHRIGKNRHSAATTNPAVSSRDDTLGSYNSPIRLGGQ